jgi:hypothetical protein
MAAITPASLLKIADPATGTLAPAATPSGREKDRNPPPQTYRGTNRDLKSLSASPRVPSHLSERLPGFVFSFHNQSIKRLFNKLADALAVLSERFQGTALPAPSIPFGGSLRNRGPYLHENIHEIKPIRANTDPVRIENHYHDREERPDCLVKRDC